MVTINPIAKVTRNITSFFFDDTRALPIPSPIGIMDISAPSEKNPIPTTSRTAPSTNSRMVPMGMGVIVILNKNTMQVIGSTEDNASLIFSFNFVIHSPLF